MEIVRTWFGSGYPTPSVELVSLFKSNSGFDDLNFSSGVPELVITLPERDEGRNHDLFLIVTFCGQS